MVESLVNEAIHMSYYMRGGVTYHDVLNMTPYERSLVSKFIEEQQEFHKEMRKAGMASWM